MKNSNRDSNGVNNFLDEAIKNGIQLDLEKEDDEPILTDEDMKRLGIPLPPNDMYNRIMNEYDLSKKKKKIRGKKVILIAAVITVLLASMLSVQAVRMYIYKISVQIMESGANLIGINLGEPEIFDVPDEEAYAQAEIELGHKLLKPTYLPSGVKFQEIKIYGDSMVKLLFSSDDNAVIRLEQEIITDAISTGAILDTDNPIVYQDVINGNEVTICKQLQGDTNDIWFIGIWADEDMIYTINSNITENEIVKVIKNMK